ncbi:MAG: sarcosine oxidase subunit delta [SAR324 cluster bacterium]|nr:sarcosine oxidase subunit delta [SAR324 cluster bacterium]
MGEFTFRGYFKSRPQQSDDFASWTSYVYFNKNKIGKQWEWWNHASGCQRWFIVDRDSAKSTDHQSVWFENRKTLEHE